MSEEGSGSEQEGREGNGPHNAWVEAQAEEEQGEEEKESEESESGMDEYEKDGFVVDEEEEAGGDVEVEGERRRERKRKKKSYNLDEEDMLLIEDAGGVVLGRDKETEEQQGKKDFKRLKKRKKETEEESSDVLKAKLRESLFGDDSDEGGSVEDQQEVQEEQEEKIDFDSESEDDLDTFIEHVDEYGQPIKRKKKKKKTRRLRVSSSQFREAADVFGEDFADMFEEEGEEFQERAPTPKKPVRQALEETYGVGELSERFMTQEDEEIRKIDVPERLQLLFPDRLKPTDEELKEEAEWIFNRAFASRGELSIQAVVPKIVYVLEFLRKECFEVPFIHTYRKDHYRPELKLPELWDIHDWDEKWAHFQSRKSALKKIHQNSGTEDRYATLLSQSQTENEVQDLFDHLKLHRGSMMESEARTKYKRAIKRDFYRTCEKAGILPLTKSFGISAEQFGDNLMNNWVMNEASDPDKAPSDLAFEYRCAEFPDVKDVLKAARHVLAVQMSHDPHVRQSIRVIFEEKAEISTMPTMKGKEADAFHPYRMILWLEKKPAVAFKGIQFLEILKAEKEGFIEVKIEIPQDYHERDLLREMRAFYLSDSTSLISESWNEQRLLILQDALNNHLYPLLQKELRQKLASEARDRLCSKIVAVALNRRLVAGPFKPKDGTDEEIRVMACCWGGIKAPTMAVMLDSEGEVIAHLKFTFLTSRPVNSSDTRPDDDKQRLAGFIMEHKPHVIGVGAQLEARNLYDELHVVVDSLPSSLQVHVAYVDLDVARIYASSRRGQLEYPDFPATLRQAISLGRLLQDPLTETAGLCTIAKDITCLRLHPLQSMIGEEYFLKIIERCFINVVSLVGVDINRAVTHRFASGPLQFVAGLGPRKAMGLINSIYRDGGRLVSRGELEGLLGPCVTTNCAGFIRIRSKHVKRSEEFEELDDTRIHPDDYNLVRKIAQNALDLDEKKMVDPDIISDIMHSPRKLDEIDLDAFAEELERNKIPKKKSTLYDIKTEITEPFKDVRLTYSDPDPIELFTLLTGETDSSLQIGQLVNARVLRVTPTVVRCKLDSDIPAIITKQDLSDTPISSIADEMDICTGMTLRARIKHVDKERLTVHLSSKSTDLSSKRWEEDVLHELYSLEPYLSTRSLDQARLDVVRKKKKRRERSINRIIEHPFFHRLTSQEAEAYLRDKDIGEVVIRPSSRGYNFLTITWKFHEENFVHINIREEQKPNKLSLGKVFVIGEERFEDLNEILARYIEPMTIFAQEVMEFRNFQLGTAEEIDNILRQRKAANPSTIPYLISIANEFPGRFILRYLPHKRVKQEFINVVPDGFRFRRNKFSNPEKLVKWFKAHWRESFPQPHPLPQEEPADYETPATYTDYPTQQPPFAHAAWDQSGWNQPRHYTNEPSGNYPMQQQWSGIQESQW